LTGQGTDHWGTQKQKLNPGKPSLLIKFLRLLNNYQYIGNCLQKESSGTEDGDQSTRGHLHGRGGTSGNWWGNWDGGVVDWWSDVGWGWGWLIGSWWNVDWGRGWWARSGGGGGAGQSASAWAVGDSDRRGLADGIGLVTLGEGGWVWAVGDVAGDDGGGGGDSAVVVWFWLIVLGHGGSDGSGSNDDSGELHFD